MRSVNHPNVVKCYEYINQDDTPCIVCEYCEDGSLFDLLCNDKKKYLSEKEAVEIFVKILDGFRAIHKAGFVHRDVKLENILLKKGEPKIADFGFAKILTSQDCTNSLCGTPPYMAPEVL